MEKRIKLSLSREEALWLSAAAQLASVTLRKKDLPGYADVLQTLAVDLAAKVGKQ